MVYNVSEDNYYGMVYGDPSVPVAIMYGADWCKPCHAFTPLLEKISEEFEGRCRFCKIDISKDTELAEMLHVQSVPTMVVLKAGKEVGRTVGTVSPARVKGLLEKAID